MDNKLIIGFWTGIKKFFDFIDFDTTSTVEMKEGRLTYDNTEGTLVFGMKGGVVKQSIGAEIYLPYQAYNNSGSTIENGKVVYIDTANLNRFNLKKASAAVYAQATETIAVATEDVLNNAHGWFTTFGLVRDINTNSFNDGDILYLSDTAGEITNVKPTSNPVIVGKCLVKHPTQGAIFVDIHNIIPKFGDVINGNYTEIEPLGTVRQNGTGRTWVDIDFPIIIRITGANNPTIATVLGNLTMPQWAVNDFNVCEIQEIIHPYAEGTPIRWHIHIITAVSDTTDRYLNWEIESNWSNVSPNSKSAWDVSNTIVTSGEFLIPANTPIRSHFVIPINTFAASDVKIAAHFKARLRRIASTGEAPSVNPFCEMLQQHVLCDTMGSRTVTAK